MERPVLMRYVVCFSSYTPRRRRRDISEMEDNFFQTCGDIPNFAPNIIVASYHIVYYFSPVTGSWDLQYIFSYVEFFVSMFYS